MGVSLFRFRIVVFAPELGRNGTVFERFTTAQLVGGAIANVKSRVRREVGDPGLELKVREIEKLDFRAERTEQLTLFRERRVS